MVYVKRLLRFAFAMTALIGVMTASLYLVAPKVVDLVSAHRSEHERISLKPLAETSYIYDRAGNKLGDLINAQNQNRVQVALRDVPETVVGSILAAEDASFYKHNGINVRSILRAVDANLESGEISQGGSTITQQVVKNSLVGDEQSLSRKLREAFLAIELEKQIGKTKKQAKDKILERYLNSVYFGGGSYGVKAAATYYFNKDIKDLDWAEGALLAALIRSPADYDPFRNPALAKKRRHIVYNRLVATKRITRDQRTLLEEVPLPTTPNSPAPPNDYFVEQVKQQLLDDPSFGLGQTAAARNQTVFSGGIRVYTTFDPALQEQAKRARDEINETLPTTNHDGTFRVFNPKTGRDTYGTQAIASVEPKTGAVRVLVGGPGYERDKSHADLTGLPGRQPGSTMKVFTLAAMFENGYVPNDTVNGGRCLFKVPGSKDTYSPPTGGGGSGTIKTMIQVSSNCGFLRLAQLVGNDKVVEMGHRLGVRTPLADRCYDGKETCPPFNLTLGTKEIPPLDMAAAYSVFANDGFRNAPYFVERIEDRFGKVIYQHRSNPERVIDTQVARLVTDVLVNNVQRGTGTKAQIDNGQPAAGKTGTTNDSTDVWFVGYTPQLATAIWMGAPTGNIPLYNAQLGGATGGRFPANTWGRFYSAIMANMPIEYFPEPAPTRKGKSVGKIPNEIGGSSGKPRRPRTGTTTPGTVPTQTTPTTPPVTVHDASRVRRRELR